MTRDLRLRHFQHRDQVADAKLASAEQVQDAKSRAIGECTKDEIDATLATYSMHIRLDESIWWAESVQAQVENFLPLQLHGAFYPSASPGKLVHSCERHEAATQMSSCVLGSVSFKSGCARRTGGVGYLVQTLVGVVAQGCMDANELADLVRTAACRVLGSEDAPNGAHRQVLAAFIRHFNRAESALLCEPSLACKTTRPPDIVLIDVEAGVHVIEVKGVSLAQVESLEAGGQFTIRYPSGPRRVNPFVQARNAMFDVRDATQRALPGAAELSVPFRYWVVLPMIRRDQWNKRWGPNTFAPPELLFLDDLHDPRLPIRLGMASGRHDHHGPVVLCPLDQLECVWHAFGDNSVLYASGTDRPSRRIPEGTLGERFDEAAEAYKFLSAEQQRLSEQVWAGGPRLVRGVAGSGKTIVLANNLARRLQRALARDEALLYQDERTQRKPRLLAVCFNRTLAPFIHRRIEAAFRQRTGQPLSPDCVEVLSFNRLMYALSRTGLWRYQHTSDAEDPAARAPQYLRDLAYIKKHSPAVFAASAYDAIYVDEGQDFAEDELRLLKELCHTSAGGQGEPDLYVFYDDAQNLYGRRRPNWQSLGLNVRGGRSTVMDECFRNTQPIIDAAFNVLYGSHAMANSMVPSRDFGDLAALEEKQLIRRTDVGWKIRFAPRDGLPTRVSLAATPRAEAELLVERLRWLLSEQRVRAEDILILTYAGRRVTELVSAITAASLPGVAAVHTPAHDRDRLLGRRGELTVSTVASAKGYDAYCVLLASTNEFPLDVKGRAHFYVGCTRASEYLEVLAYRRHGLAYEFERAAAPSSGPGTAITK